MESDNPTSHLSPTTTPTLQIALEGASTATQQLAASNPQNPSKTRVKRKGGTKRSEVWDHFDTFKDEEGDFKARCKYCKKEYYSDTNKNGTSSLKTHMTLCKEFPHNKDITQAQINFKISEDGKATALSAWKFNASDVRKALSYFIIIDELPFKIVEGVGFKYFLAKALGHQFRCPSRFTIQRDCYEIYLVEKAKLKSILNGSCQMICLTTDTWTSIQRINYMCLTAHWIDDDWVLRKRVLNFCPISSHRGEDLGKAVENCLMDWGIDKVFTITVDNASSNDVMVSYLKRRFNNVKGTVLDGKYLHMRCIAHIINLVVNDGLKEIGESVSRIRTAVRYVRQSPSRFENFKNCVSLEKLEYKSGLCLDVPTRWNSTYFMLNAAQQYEQAFERFDIEDRFFRSEMEKVGGVPLESDWDNARKLCEFLKRFFELTLLVSGSSYVTSNCHLHEISKVLESLENLQMSNDLSLQRMAKKMKEKYDKYWGSWEKMNMLTYVAVVLDPRWKFSFIEFSLETLYPSTYIEKVELVKDAAYQLFSEYKTKYGSFASNQLNEVVTDIENEDDVVDLRSRFKRFKALNNSVVSKSELEKYLNEENEIDSKEFDILSYWKENSLKFPILSRMARDILAVPISTVASESTFSTSGRVLNPFRSSLTPKIVQSLVCTEDWLRNNFSASKIDYEEEDLNILEQLEFDMSKLAFDPITNM